MNFYLYTPDSNAYHSVTPEPLPPVDWITRFKGEALGEQWSPLPVRLDRAHRLGDLMALNAVLPVISDRALECLRPLIADEVEVLPLDLLEDVGTRYHLLHVTRIIDCLDREASDLHTFEDHILHVRHYVLDEEKLDGVGIFRITGFELGRCLLSPAFRQAAEENGLTGLLWKPVP